MGDNILTISENNKRIAKNTLILYVRMLLLMFISLYTSRVILEALGIEDFGVYNVVGGFVGMLGFFTSSLTNASQRYLNLGIGNGDDILTIKYFKQCGTILLIFSIITLLLGETIGLWFVMNKLVIPIERIHAAFWVYQFSLISIVCSINQVNFLGAIVAYEKMSIYAYLGLFEAFSRLAIAFIIIRSSYDHLILYAGMTASISILVLLFHLIYCKSKFQICKIGICWDRGLITEMTKFISINLFGCFAWSAGIQGSNIIMNMFFGPVVNAAKGISMQVSSVITKFTNSVMTAIKPQIIKSYASGEISYMLNLIMKSSKLSFFISVIIAVPILMETEYILEMWLKDVPEYTVSFSRIVIIESLASVFINPLWIAANATGNIKRNQIYGRLFTLAVLPFSYVLLCIVLNPVLPMVVCALMQYLYLIYCIYDIKIQLKMNLYLYIKRVIVPSFILFMILIFIGLLVNEIWGSGTFIHFLMNSMIIVATGILVAYLLMTSGERELLTNFIGKIFKNKN